MMAVIVNAVREEVIVTSRASTGGVALISTLSSSATLAARQVGAGEAFAGTGKYMLYRTKAKQMVHWLV